MLSPFCVYINCGFYELLKSHLRKVATRKEIKEHFTYQFMYSVAYIAIFTINMMFFPPYYLNVYSDLLSVILCCVIGVSCHFQHYTSFFLK